MSINVLNGVILQIKIEPELERLEKILQENLIFKAYNIKR